MNAILVPGRPDKDEHYDHSIPSNNQNYWFGWLQRQLILKDIHTNSIEPPFPFRPRYKQWKKEFERFDINEDTILVGHSCGGGFLIRWLSENKKTRVGKVFLVAPWINPDNNPKSDTADFFKFKISKSFPLNTEGVTVFISEDDYPSVVQTVDILKTEVPGLDIKQYTNRGHFTSIEFEELLNLIVE